MLHWLKRRLAAWVEKRQRREIARLKRATDLLKEEVERTTGQPVRLTPEERQRLAEKARGIDPELLKEVSVLDTEQLAALIDATGSAETR